MTADIVSLEELFPTHVSGFWGKEAGTLDVDVRIVRNGDIRPDGSVRWDDLPTRAVSRKEYEKSVVEAGDLLLTTSGNCARVAYIDHGTFAVCASNFTRLLRADPDLADSRYLFHMMRSEKFLGMCAPYVRGTTMENLSVKEAFSSVRLPLPPMEEQRRIASILDAADVLRSKRRRTVELLNLLVRSIANELLNVSDASNKASLGTLVDHVVVGHVGPTSEHVADEGVPLLRTGNVGDGEIKREGLLFITQEFHDSLKKSQLRTGDVIVSRHISSSVRCAIVPPDLDGANCANIIVIRPGSVISPQYLKALIRSPGAQEALLSHRVGSAQTVVNTKVFQDWQIPVPDRDLVLAFEAQMTKIDSLICHIRAALDKADLLFASLQQRAFRGEL